MFNWFKNYVLNAEIKKYPVKKEFVDWSKIQSAVILVNSEEFGNDVKEFIRDSGKDMYIVLFHDDKISKTTNCFLSVNKNDLNWLDIPKTETLNKIRNKTYDLLINTDFKDRKAMKSFSGLIPARFKIGPESLSYSHFFDINIKSGKADYLRQALKYLMMIKN